MVIAITCGSIYEKKQIFAVIDCWQWMRESIINEKKMTKILEFCMEILIIT